MPVAAHPALSHVLTPTFSLLALQGTVAASCLLRAAAQRGRCDMVQEEEAL